MNRNRPIVLLCSLVAELLFASLADSTDFVPGLPVFSSDGTIATSKTVPGFRANVRRITPPDSLTASYSETKVDHPEVMVDGRGRVWMAWSLGTMCNGEPCSGGYLAELDQNGLAGPVVPVFPFDTYYWWRYEITMGPHGPWCASWTIPWEERRNEGYFSPVQILPCGDSSSGLSFEEFGGWFEFIGEEPVMITPWGDGLTIRWNTQSSRIKEILPEGISYHWFGGSTIDISRAGHSLVALWRSYFNFPMSGGGISDHNFISIIHKNSEDIKIDRFSTQHYDATADADVPRNLSLALGVGSDGPSRLFVSFLEDNNPELEDPPPNYYYYLSVETEPKVRAYEAATLDSLAEWTLGYGEIKSAFPNHDRTYHFIHWIRDRGNPPDFPSYVTITSNYRNVGFAVSREGILDLWVLVGQSWYGPYQITSNISGAADIAVDADGRYWLVWDDDADVYAALVTPADLGLEDIPTAVAEPRPTAPSTPMLGKNSPNPFNTQTAIELQVPSGYMTLDIFNLGGQLIYSTAVSRGTTRATWDGTNQEGSPVASGVYLYRLRDGNRTWAMKRMLLIR